MSWSDAVWFAIRRAKHEDTGAIAAREGILGLPLSQTSSKAQRVYAIATTQREEHNKSRARRNQPPLEPGTTGNGKWDKDLNSTLQEA